MTVETPKGKRGDLSGFAGTAGMVFSIWLTNYYHIPLIGQLPIIIAFYITGIHIYECAVKRREKKKGNQEKEQ